jgi:diketogulonate reductase-like aldo/keto reductase
MPRRRDLCLAGVASAAFLVRAQTEAVLTRVIPSTGEPLPAVGLGTWLTFDVPIGDAPAMARRQQVVDRFLAGGGRLVDSSPMYGHAEAVLGELLRPGDARVFSATKVWTPLSAYGPTQMRRSLALWKRPRADLMQVHNLLNWRAHLPTLREWKARGLVRHIGVTTSHGSAHDEMARIVETERGLDFMQITYSPADRRAEPLIERAAARGLAVIVNRPFDGGALLDRLARVPLPKLAQELGCAQWAVIDQCSNGGPMNSLRSSSASMPDHLGSSRNRSPLYLRWITTCERACVANRSIAPSVFRTLPIKNGSFRRSSQRTSCSL